MSKKAEKVKEYAIDAVDLFCGGGGLTCGLRQAGIDVRMGVDFDGRCEYNDRQLRDAREPGECCQSANGASSQFQYPMKRAA